MPPRLLYNVAKVSILLHCFVAVCLLLKIVFISVAPYKNYDKQLDKFCRLKQLNRHEVNINNLPTSISKHVKILCLIETSDDLTWLHDVIRKTWASQCAQTIFISASVKPGQTSWSTFKTGLKMAYDQRKDFDWLVKANSDSYIYLDRLENVLSQFDENELLVFGRPFLAFTETGEEIHYVDNGAGVVLSMKALEILVQVGLNIENAEEDENADSNFGFGRCLAKVKIPIWNLVEKDTLCELFQFHPYWKTPTENEEQIEMFIRSFADPCPGASAKWICSKHPISFHGISGASEMTMVFENRTNANNNW